MRLNNDTATVRDIQVFFWRCRVQHTFYTYACARSSTWDGFPRSAHRGLEDAAQPVSLT